MEITMPWGNENLRLNLPDTWTVIQPGNSGREASKKESGLSIVKRALKKPSGLKALSSMKLKGKKIVIVVDDNTRLTPVHAFMHLVLQDITMAGGSLKNTILIPALGIHTPMSAEEMAEKVGDRNLKKLRWENHNAFDQGKNHFFGTTSRGTPVFLNTHLRDADLVVLIGLIEPHLWAGFGGGMKNILPGVASAETISRHHGIIAEPPYRFNRVGMKPEENSFRQDLEETRGMIKAEIFCLNVSIDHTGEVVAAFAGEPIAAHRNGMEYNYSRLGLALDEQVDAIIVNSYPMDINLKQSMKCVGNSLPALKPGGVVMGFLRAERGVDDISLPEDSKPLWFVKTILRLIGPSRVWGFLEKVKKGLNVEEKFLVYYSMQLIRQYELYFHVPSLSEQEVKLLGFFRQHQTPQQVIDSAVKKIGKHARVAVFPRGGATFPVVGRR